MKTIVLDDDPTGTQSAQGVDVLLEPLGPGFADELRGVLEQADAVYVQTNSRALDPDAAVELVRSVRRTATDVADQLGADVRFVLRGDSTLRGHVFAETEEFAGSGAVMLFVPAFPQGGRTTVDGVHWVVVRGERIRADETEFAQDPVFPFRSALLTRYVRDATEHTAHPRRGISVPLAAARGGGLVDVLAAAGPADVVLPDVEDDADVRSIAAAVRAAEARGVRVVIRCAAPLAAELAGVASEGLLPLPVVDRPVPTLVAVGSHTAATTAQVAALRTTVHELDVDVALADPPRSGSDAAAAARPDIEARGFAVVATARHRRADHDTLDHGERVMRALTSAVRELLPDVGLVVAKGGITSAEVARTGIGASRATVLGQILPGVSLWRLRAADGRDMLYVVVPGNVGDDDTLVRVLDAVRVATDITA